MLKLSHELARYSPRNLYSRIQHSASANYISQTETACKYRTHDRIVSDGGVRGLCFLGAMVFGRYGGVKRRDVADSCSAETKSATFKILRQ